MHKNFPLNNEINTSSARGILYTLVRSTQKFINLCVHELKRQKAPKHRVVSLNGNNLLITVSGDIIEEKKYPS